MEFGLRLFEEAASGRTPLEGDAALLYIYGIYLSNGGKPDDFMDLTLEDIQIMFTAYFGSQKRAADSIIRALMKAMNKREE